MAPSSSIPRKLRNLVGVGHRRRALFAEAMVEIGRARLELVFVPFPRIAARLGDFLPPSAGASAGIVVGSEATARLAKEISWAVTRAAAHAPFSAVCLPQALAARRMLKRRGVASIMHFGARRGDAAKSIDAHAWLDAAGVKVTGYPVAREFTEIACFV
jgi:hypothetical protein